MSKRQGPRGRRPSASGTLLPHREIRARVTRERVQAVLDELAAGRRSVPAERRSLGHCLPYRGAHYAPKYVACVAGDIEVNQAAGLHWMIKEVGFPVVDCTCGGLGSPDPAMR